MQHVLRGSATGGSRAKEASLGIKPPLAKSTSHWAVFREACQYAEHKTFYRGLESEMGKGPSSLMAPFNI